MRKHVTSWKKCPSMANEKQRLSKKNAMEIIIYRRRKVVRDRILHHKKKQNAAGPCKRPLCFEAEVSWIAHSSLLRRMRTWRAIHWKASWNWSKALSVYEPKGPWGKSLSWFLHSEVITMKQLGVFYSLEKRLIHSRAPIKFNGTLKRRYMSQLIQSSLREGSAHIQAKWLFNSELKLVSVAQND